MPPIEKKDAFDIVEFNDGFTVDCIHSLKTECSIALNELQHFRVCYENARVDRSHLDRTGIDCTERPIAIIPNCNKRIEQEARDGVLKNLTTYKLKPEGVKGNALLSHMIYYRELNNEGTGNSKYTMEASAHLNVEISESNTQVLENTNRLIAGENIDAKRPILKDAYGAGAFQHIARRKLDSCGIVKKHCGFANDAERLQRFENLTMLTASVAVINAMKHNNKESKEKETKEEMNQIIETTIKLLLK